MNYVHHILSSGTVRISTVVGHLLEASFIEYKTKEETHVHSDRGHVHLLMTLVAHVCAKKADAPERLKNELQAVADQRYPYPLSSITISESERFFIDKLITLYSDGKKYFVTSCRLGASIGTPLGVYIQKGEGRILLEALHKAYHCEPTLQKA